MSKTWASLVVSAWLLGAALSQSAEEAAPTVAATEAEPIAMPALVAPPAEPQPACAAEKCSGHAFLHGGVCDWLCYKSSRPDICCSCKQPVAVCTPPLYAFFPCGGEGCCQDRPCPSQRCCQIGPKIHDLAVRTKDCVRRMIPTITWEKPCSTEWESACESAPK